ncbi:MAG TPA: cytochrome c oxidase subunit 3 [Candidatus Limnocylindrales bacterium]|nr:cytochrome c oxidase subunit 3 [Candidatus Limnocylindrales bacterium]
MTSESHALTEHSPVAALPHDVRGGISNPVLGMILFITSEVMFFAGLFAAYFTLRAAAPAWPPEEFHDILKIWPIVEDGVLNLVGIATVILVASSFTCQFAVWAIRRGDRTLFLRNIGVTLVMGVTFLLLQAIDYAFLASEGLTLSAGPFGTTYFTLTGFHGAHVLAGAVMLAVVLYRGMAGQFSARHHDAVEATSLYWHFVDVVWIALFTTLYVLPGHGG